MTNKKQIIFCLLCICMVFCLVAMAQYTTLPLVTQKAHEQMEETEYTAISFAAYHKID